LVAGIALAIVLLLAFILADYKSKGSQEQAGVGAQPAQTRPVPQRPSPLDQPIGAEPATVARTNTRSRGDTEQDLHVLVDRWAAAFRARDLNDHMSFYAPTVDRFFLKRNVSADQVRQTKEQALSAAGNIEQYKIENVQTKMESPTRATVTFDKTYSFTGSTSGKVLGVLYLRKTNDEWRIVGERDLRVYWQKKST
jgi:ketosteroid isomerase-like protein